MQFYDSTVENSVDFVSFFSFNLRRACDGVALSKLTPLAGAGAASAAAGATTPTVHTIPGELEELQSVLHFPEEVALRITDAEYQLFYQVRWNMQNLCVQTCYASLALSLKHVG